MLRRLVIAPALLVAGAAVLVQGCSVFVIDTEQQQCVAASDCVSLGLGDACVDGVCVDGGGEGGEGGGGGAPADPKWGCLGSVEWPPATQPTSVLRVRFRSAVSMTPPANLAVRYCASLDVDCATPIAADVPVVDGRIELEVESGTRGYFEVTSTADPPTIRPAVLYFPRPASESSTPEDLPVTLVSPNEYLAIVNSAGFVDDPTRGTLLTVTTDCTAAPAAGVELSSPSQDEDSTPFYFVGLVPDPDATQTDVNGFGGIFNMPVGAGTVEARIAADDRLIGFASFQIRAGWLSNVAIEPTPIE
ncbi:MAG: hypothetical protein IPM79_04190 [Polyangiaceae bacterium]|nr:hypothetical protein [Polyangiaceae bacterium]